MSVQILTEAVTPETTNEVAEKVTKVVEHFQQHGAWYLVGLLAVVAVIAIGVAVSSKGKTKRKRY